MLSYVFTTSISHLSSATIPTYSTCPYSIPMSILCASMQESYSPCQIWTIDAPFCAELHYKCISDNQIKLVVIVVAFQFSSCTFIHQRPWHNCVTILGHLKYKILVYHARTPETAHAASMSHSIICIGSKQSQWMFTNSHCNHPRIGD